MIRYADDRSICGCTTEDEFWRDPDPTPTTLPSSCTSDMTVEVRVDGVAIAMMDKEWTAERSEGGQIGRRSGVVGDNQQAASASLNLGQQSGDQARKHGPKEGLWVSLRTQVRPFHTCVMETLLFPD